MTPNTLALVTAVVCILTILIGRKLLYRETDLITQIVLGVGNTVMLTLCCAAFCAYLNRFSIKAFLCLFGCYLLLAVPLAVWLYFFWKDKAQIKLRLGIIPLLLLAAAFYCYRLPSQIVVGSQDPSVYVASAATMAHSRHTVLTSPVLLRLTPEERTSLLGLHPGYNWPYNGIYLFDDGSAQYRFDFLRGPSLLLAFAFLFQDKEAAFLVNSLYSVLAVFYFFLILRTLIPQGVACLGSLLLVFCPAELWFGRATYSEVCSQFVILGTVIHLLWFESKRLEPPMSATDKEEEISSFRLFLLLAVGCISAAQSMMMRVDQTVVVFLLILIIPCLSLVGSLSNSLSRKKLCAQLFGAQCWLLLCTLLVCSFNQKTGAHYISRLKRELFFADYILHILATCFILSLPLYLPWLQRFLLKILSWLRAAFFSESGKALSLLLLICFLAWELVLRVKLFPPEMFGAIPPHNAHKRTMNEFLFHRLSILTGIPILLLSFVGLWQMLRKRPRVSLIFLGLLFLIFGSKLFISQVNSPMLYWASRRYLPVMIPSAILFGVSLLFSLKLFASQRANRIFSSGLYCLSLLPMLYLSQALLPHGEMNGAMRSTLELEKRFRPEETVILSDSKAIHQNFTFRFLGNYPVLQINGLNAMEEPVSRLLPGLVDRLKAEGKHVIMFLGDPKQASAFAGLKHLGMTLSQPEYIDAPYFRMGEPFFNFPRDPYPLNNGVWFSKL